MRGRLCSASLALLAFALLAVALTAGGLVTAAESLRSTVAVAFALLPGVLGGPVGWRGRATQLLLLPPAAALLLARDPSERGILVSLLLAILAVVAGALSLPATQARFRPLCTAAVALSLTAAGSASLAGRSVSHIALALTPAVVAAVAARRVGATTALVLSLGALLPVATTPGLALLPVLLAAAAARWCQRLDAVAARFVPLALAGACVSVALGQWGGMELSLALPHANWPLISLLAVALVAIPRLPPALLGIGWLATTLLLGAPQPPTGSGQSVQLTAAAPVATLPLTGSPAPLIETSLAHAGGLRDGVQVATIQAGTLQLPLRVGRDTAEWAHERDDVRNIVAHSLPDDPVWRPAGAGRNAFWAVAGRTAIGNHAADEITLDRNPDLPDNVVVTVTARQSSPQPPRSWPLASLLLAAALATAAIQFLAGTWRAPSALVPWLVLLAGSAMARVPVAPLQALLERHSVDFALIALVAAWLPAARTWLPTGRFFFAALAFLLPVALATPHLTAPMYGDEPYHLAILDAFAHGSTVRDAVSAGAPPGLAPLQGPLLAVLLLPGYLLAGRSGALALLAVGAAGVVSLLAARSRTLGIPRSRIALLVTLVIFTAPLATYASQIWPEVPGALAVALCLVFAAGPPRMRFLPLLIAVLAAALETRLAIYCFPVAAAALCQGRGGTRSLLRAVALLAAAAVVALGAAWLFLGHLLGAPRSLASLVPGSARQAVLAAGGLFFDPSAGFATAAPFLLVALLGVPRLWLRGTVGERAALLGVVGTVLALFHSVEWYGGGSPPVRYLVAGLPVIWLAGAHLLRRPPPALAAAALLLPPALAAPWALLTRPHLSVNPGSGRFYLADALSQRFATDTRHLLPSFLVPSSATWIFPSIVVLVLVGTIALAAARPTFVRNVGRQSATLWLAVMSALTIDLSVRTDRTVQIEDLQVEHVGGRPEPPPGTWSNYLHPAGWRIGEGQGVVVPVRMSAPLSPQLSGWLEGPAREGCRLDVQWNAEAVTAVPLAGAGPGAIFLPPPLSAGRHTLRLTLRAARGGEAVLDRLVVAP